MGIPLGAGAATPLFHHDFNSAKDASGTYNCQPMSGAQLTKIGDEGILELGDSNGWFDFSEAFGQLVKNLSGDYTIAANILIPETTPLGANGNFILNFGNSSSEGYAFFGANQSRYSTRQTILILT